MSAVTLTVDEAKCVAEYLRGFSAERFAHAKRTKSAAIREYCYATGAKANELEAKVIERLYR